MKRDFAPTVRGRRGKGPHGKRGLRQRRVAVRTEHEQAAIMARKERRVSKNLPLLQRPELLA